MPRRSAIAVLVVGVALLLAACDRPRTEVTILSGSENQSIEPIVQDFCRRQSVTCHVHYKGSLDIGLAIAENRIDFDAVWPANSIWIDLFDKTKVVRDLAPIMRSQSFSACEERRRRTSAGSGATFQPPTLSRQ